MSVLTGKTQKSFWEVWTFDVWGNSDDGYEVNDRCKIAGTHELTEWERENDDYDLSVKEIIDAFCLCCEVGEIDIEYDDVDHVFVKAAHDGYPIGELIRVDSLGRK